MSALLKEVEMKGMLEILAKHIVSTIFTF